MADLHKHRTWRPTYKTYCIMSLLSCPLHELVKSYAIWQLPSWRAGCGNKDICLRQPPTVHVCPFASSSAEEQNPE